MKNCGSKLRRWKFPIPVAGVPRITGWYGDWLLGHGGCNTISFMFCSEFWRPPCTGWRAGFYRVFLYYLGCMIYQTQIGSHISNYRGSLKDEGGGWLVFPFWRSHPPRNETICLFWGWANSSWLFVMSVGESIFYKLKILKIYSTISSFHQLPEQYPSWSNNKKLI